jgi:predicted DNA-binding transcriptional regulator AlpA
MGWVVFNILDLLQKILQALDDLNANQQEKLWTKTELLNYFSVGLTTLDCEIISNPTFPRPVKISKSMRWIPEEVKSWAKKNRA